ncbi:MAG: hypothetical protein EXR69_04345 [Myxococcales bacterium]|nr:hypothetical protein [Myxococcales bacterium]
MSPRPPLAPSSVWNLDSIFPGGPMGDAFKAAATSAEQRLKALLARSDALGPATTEAALTAIAGLLLELEDIAVEMQTLGTFTGCHAAADAVGRDALRADARASELWTLYGRASVTPNDRVIRMEEPWFQRLLSWPGLEHMQGDLLERRRLGRLRLPEAEEALATELARDGILAWGELYDEQAGALRITVDRGNGPESLSPGQVSQLLGKDDAALRERAFEAQKAGWRSIAPVCAKALTHITGTRIALNARRGLDTLDEPLANAKIERSTLDALLETARAAAPLMSRYIAAKARALGKTQLSWTDTFALLGTSSGEVSYPYAQEFIVEQFRGFSPALADFSERAFRESWVEVEDRPGKRGGGFCAEVPTRNESRIFMTWGNNEHSLSTLAHELGHAFHNEVLNTVPPAQRRLPMTLAETASTFGEALVREAALAATTDPQQRLRLLDASLSDALAYLTNIPARFELEQRLYTLRAEGPLDPEQLEAETTAIYTRWYGPGVAQVDPMYWANKLHFYIGGLAFYNFPYLFGYLFSALVYEHFRPMGPAGAPGYERLLRRTGDAWAEPIALEELGLDLAKPEIWALALRSVERDLCAFEALV